MKKIYYLTALSFFCLLIFFKTDCFSQGGTWEWIKGSNLRNPVPVYGAKGAPDANNVPQGFYEATNWSDKQGNFWIFAGLDSSFSETNDLWMYNPASNIWTWIGGSGGVPDQPGIYGMKGVPSPANYPGARGWSSISWTDNNGDLWMFGGLGWDTSGALGYLNDLWRYNIASNQWTWVSGSSHVNPPDEYGTLQQPSDTSMPGGRQECSSSWVDSSNNLWLFGGLGINGFYNDMWRYNTSTNQWTWMKGARGAGDPGQYGSLGVEDATNLPPSRGTYSRWKDAAGNFYIWGGIKSFFPGHVFSDVWKYNISTNNWIWVAGDSVPDSKGNYGQQCTDNGKTGPAARGENRTAQVLGCTNAFLTFGGFVFDTLGNTPGLNDLWLFNSQTSDWKWVSGTSIPSDSGSYGAIGVPAPSNLPPARYGAVMWVDNSGVLWVFAGQDINSLLFNDLWKFTPNSSCIQASFNGGIPYQLSSTQFCRGDSAMLTLNNVSHAQIFPSSSVTWIDTAHAFLYPDTTTTYLITGQTPCYPNDSAQFTITVIQPVLMQYVLSDSVICLGDSAFLSISNATGVVVSPDSSVIQIDALHFILKPGVTTSYTITGQSQCSNNKIVIKVEVTTGSCSIISVPAPSKQVVGNHPNTIYLGYGPQSATLVSSVSGSNYSYSWSPQTGLSCTHCPAPVFTPTEEGDYTFTLTATSASGCVSTCTITICVLDVRETDDGNNAGKKVFVCHIPPGNPANPQTLCISINAVPAHVPLHGGDYMGKCDQFCIPDKNAEAEPIIAEQVSETFSLVLYPNPFINEIHLEAESPDNNSSVEVKMFDITGQLVFIRNDIEANKDVLLQPNLARGIYFLEAKQGASVEMHKLIKM